MAEKYERDTSSYDRALGFFDAVYGFSLTLLVTTIDITRISTWKSLGSLLSSNGSQLVSFAVSFVVIAVFWRQNHKLLAHLRGLDGVTIWANIVVMAFVVLIPFTTEAMGNPKLHNQALPTALYALNVAVAILANLVIYEIAIRRDLVEGFLSRRARRAQVLNALTAPAIFLLSIPVTYLSVSTWGNAMAGQLFWLLQVGVGPVFGRWSARIVATG